MCLAKDPFEAQYHDICLVEHCIHEITPPFPKYLGEFRTCAVLQYREEEVKHQFYSGTPPVGSRADLLRKGNIAGLKLYPINKRA